MENNFKEKNEYPPESRTRRVLRIIGMVFVGLVFVVLFALVFGFLVKWLWNALMPDLFGLKAITYWQAFGMVILAKLLFGAFGAHQHDRWGKEHPPFRRWHDHFRKPEEEPWSQKSRHWKHYKEYWQDEGKAAFEAYMGRKEENNGN
ncbi:MAG: hypothetical protein JRJ85_23640 [Deltaproteobacteria bacterium]|nr:hypothetical protein [Deltaproteobacteria bacterium]